MEKNSPNKSDKSLNRKSSARPRGFWDYAVKGFCQWAVRKFRFWALVGAFALLEPVLCSYRRTTLTIALQVIVLAISTFLYFIQIVGVATTEWDKIQAIKALGSMGSVFVPRNESQLTMMKVIKFFTAEGEFLVEGCMLLAGWILIFWHPGLAILRCFRVFRLLWFYEVHCFKSSMLRYFGPIFGEGFVIRGFKVLKFAIKALSALGDEIFRLTPETRGGLLLIMMIFFSAWVLGATIYVETNGQAANCTSQGACTYNLMRLTFFDGNGLDLAYSLLNGYKILFFISMMYMCITAFGIINGLVGIFGTLFQTASEKAFEQEDEDDIKYGRPEEDVDDDDDLESIPEEEGLQMQNQRPFGGASGGEQGEPVIEAPGKFTEAQKRSASDLLKSVQGEAEPLTEAEMKDKLSGALGKQPSRLALQEFQNEQRENSPRAPGTFGSRPGSAANARKTIPTGVELYNVDGPDALDAVTEAKVKNKPTGGGIFGKPKVPAAGASSSAHDLTIKQLVGQMAHMQQKIDQQNELILSMFNQILALNKQLAATGAIPPISSPGPQRPSSAVAKQIQVSPNKFPTQYAPAPKKDAVQTIDDDNQSLQSVK